MEYGTILLLFEVIFMSLGITINAVELFNIVDNVLFCIVDIIKTLRRRISVEKLQLK